MEPKKKTYQVQFRVVAIVEANVKAESMQDALEIAEGYTLGDIIPTSSKAVAAIHDGSIKVVGVDDDWGDLES